MFRHHHLFLTLREWRCRARTRREIARMTGGATRELGHDIGLSGNQLLFEAGKPFWRA
jgi:uncharacterized protein YjiS (DUF1127 family)